MQIRSCALVALLLGCAPHHVAGDAMNSLTDLGTLGGRTRFGNGINNLGQVTGSSDTTAAGLSHALVYSSGQPRGDK
jgi:probable HAF family extracellular repeat protein